MGFCMGYYCEDNDYIKNYFKHNLFRIFFRCLYLGVTFNKSFYRKLFQKKGGQKVCAVQPSADSIAANRCGDLLSICVLPEHRGKGAAQSLINRYLKTLEAKSRELCYLTVDKDNSRAIAFYKRNGFELYCQRGAKMTCFCKLRGHGDCLS